MALTQVSSAGIKNAEVKTEDILDANITTAKIADDAVTADKLANSINTEIAANTAKVSLENDSVTGAKIADDAVGAEHIEVLDANLDFADDAKARFGTSDDLEIFHGGGHSKIYNANGNIYISNESGNTSNVVLQATWGEESVIANHNGAVDLYYDNSLKARTYADGFRVNGDFWIDNQTNTGKDIWFDESANTFRAYDDVKFTCGNSDDLQIYHNGSHGYITEGTGNLKISAASGPIQILKGSSENIAAFTPDGSCELYYDNSLKLATSAGGASVTGDFSTSGDVTITGDGAGCKLQIGAGQDFQAWHDSHNYLDSLGTAELRIRVKENESAIIAKPDGAVELYYNNHKSFNTSSTGISIYGTEGAEGCIHMYADEGDDNEDYWRLTAGTDTTWYCQNYAAGSYETNIKANGNGNVELYYDNTKRFETYANGSRVNGNLHVTGNLLLEDNDSARFGDGEDLQIYHDGNNSYIEDAGTGSLILKTGRVSFNDTGNNEMGRFDGEGLKFNGDSAAANGLDDYEEGTWTPDFYHHSSVSNVYGHYTKIGRMVYAYFTGVPYSTSSSHQYISNLPFTTANIGGGVGGVARGYQNFDIQDGPIYYVENNSTQMTFYKDNGSAMAAVDCNGKSLRGMVVYTAAS